MAEISVKRSWQAIAGEYSKSFLTSLKNYPPKTDYPKNPGVRRFEKMIRFALYSLRRHWLDPMIALPLADPS
jgi:hypothetical protein